MIAVPSFIVSIVGAILLGLGETRATSYGCYVTGNWACYPTPQVCYNYGSPPVDLFDECCLPRPGEFAQSAREAGEEEEIGESREHLSIGL
jgi:hypothetical protein